MNKKVIERHTTEVSKVNRLKVFLVLSLVIFILSGCSGRSAAKPPSSHSQQASQPPKSSESYCDATKVYENPPVLYEEPLSVSAKLKSINSNSIVCYDEKIGLFTIDKSYIKPIPARFLMEHGIEFHALVKRIKNSNAYKILKDPYGVGDISILVNGVFVKELSPDVFVFKTDEGVKLIVSGMKADGMDSTMLAKKIRSRIRCAVTDRVVNGTPVFRYISGKDLSGD